MKFCRQKYETISIKGKFAVRYIFLGLKNIFGSNKYFYNAMYLIINLSRTEKRNVIYVIML